MGATEPASAARAAFEILVREHHRRLLAYARALIADDSTAEDLVQEAFVAAYRDLDRFDRSRDFASWMRGIVRHKFLHHIQRRQEQPMDPSLLAGLEHMHATWDEAEQAGHGDALTALSHCLHELGGLLRSCIISFYISGKPVADIARTYGASEEVVRKRLQRGRESLAACVRLRLAVSGDRP